jgi:hypothetical protein
MTNDLNLNLESWAYQTPNAVMVPYRAAATSFYPEDFLVSLYYRLVEQDLLTVIFPGMAISHLNKFINFMSTHACVICFTKDGNRITDTAGFGYIPETDGVDGARKASFGFGFFREHHATQEARTLSWFMLAFWLIELKIDVLFGTTLKSNGLARNFSLNFGFKNHVDIPKLFFREDELQDATVMLLEKEDFIPRYESWRETWEAAEVVGG